MWTGLAAEAYDRALPLGASFGDLEFYRDRLQGPCLEPMCGSGRFLIPLFDEGLEIDGFDLSADMIARAKARAARLGLKPRLEIADVADFDMRRSYASVVVPVSSFLMLEPTLARTALRRFYDHLQPGGTLWLDTHAPPFAAFESEKDVGDIHVSGSREVVTSRFGRHVETITRGRETVQAERTFYVWKPKRLRGALLNAGFASVVTHERAPFLVFEARRRG